MSTASFTGPVPDTYHTFLGPMLFEPYARDLAQRLNLQPHQHILELASGTGIVTKEIARLLPPNATLLATDLNEAMLAVGRPLIPADPRITFQTADACTLPFPDNSFDTLACQYGLMFFPDKIAAMRKARRVLRPGGRYILSVWDALTHNPIPQTVHESLTTLFPTNPIPFITKMPFGYNDRTEIERITRAGGFTNVTIETLSFPSSAPTADDAARPWLQGTPILPALKERGITDPTEIRQKIAHALAQKFGNTPCQSTMQALIITAS